MLPTLLSFGLFVVSTAAAGWNKTSVKYYKGTFYTTYSRDYNLPQGDGGTPGATIRVLVRAFRNGSEPKRCIFLVPGGPGQSGKGSARNMHTLEGDEFRDSWVFVMDHRGVGQSSKISSDKTIQACAKDVEKCSLERTKAPIRSFSTANAVNDLIAVVEDTKKAHPKAQFHAIGISYGSYLLYRLLSQRGDLFDRVILADFFGSYRLPPRHDLSVYLMRNCHRNGKCKRYFPNVDYPAMVMSKLTDRNECTKALTGEADLKQYILGGDLRTLVQFMVEGLMKAYEPKGPQNPQAILLYFLRQLEHCKDPALFRSHLGSWLGTLRAIGHVSPRKSDQSSTMMEPAELNGVMAAFADPFKANLFINQYINYSEMSGTGMDACVRAGLGDLFNGCTVNQVFLDTLKDVYERAKYSNGGGWDRKGITVKGSVILVMGQMDVATPYLAARQYFDAIKATSKDIIVSRNFGHGGIASRTSCGPWRALLGDRQVSAVKGCVSRVNEAEQDWMKYGSFNFETVYARLSPAELGPAKEAKDVDPNAAHSVRSSGVILVLVVSLIGMFL